MLERKLYGTSPLNKGFRQYRTDMHAGSGMIMARGVHMSTPADKTISCYENYGHAGSYLAFSLERGLRMAEPTYTRAAA
jgi:hypothetical protein